MLLHCLVHTIGVDLLPGFADAEELWPTSAAFDLQCGLDGDASPKRFETDWVMMLGFGC